MATVERSLADAPAEPPEALDPAQVDGLGDMEPEAFRAAAHRVVDLMADYLAGIEGFAVLPADRARLGRRGAARRSARDAREPRRDPRRHAVPDRPERDPLAAPGLLRLLRLDRVGAGDPRRDARRGARPEPDALADVAQRHGARGGRRRLAAPGARAAGRVRRPAHRYGVDVVADRPRRRPAGRGDRRRGVGDRRAVGRARAPGLCLGGGPLLDRQGVHDPRAGSGVAASASRRTTGSSCARTRSTRRSPRIVRRAVCRSRSWRPSGPPRPPRSTRSPRSRTSPPARASGSTSTPRTPAPSRSIRACAARSRGWERADSIVVNPHKWLWTPVDASLLLSRRLEVVRDAFSLVPEYLRTVDSIGDGSERNYNEYTPQLGRRFRALKLWLHAALVRARGPPRGGSATTWSWRGNSPAGSMPRRTGSGSRPSRSRRSASAMSRPPSPATTPRSTPTTRR